MIAAIQQPYFIPYISYWQLIDSVDQYAIADNYNYKVRGWISRCRILNCGRVQYFNIPVQHASQNRYICNHSIVPIDKKSKMRHLQSAYCHAPYRREGLELMDQILSFEGDNLADFLYRSIRLVCEHLQIETKIVRTSDFDQDPGLRFADRLYDYCHQMGADAYHNLIGGRSLYNFDDFAAQGIKLAFVEPISKPYPQSSESFEFGLSIIDVIMNNSVGEIQELLKSYRLITEPEASES